MSTNYFLLEQGCLNPYQINLLNKINKKNKKEYISLLDKVYLNTKSWSLIKDTLQALQKVQKLDPYMTDLLLKARNQAKLTQK